MRKVITIVIVSFYSITSFYGQEDNTKYVDPTIGNVARFLEPTYPSIQLPNN